MPLTVKRATLWRRELTDKPGTLADTLKPFAKSGVNLQVIMGYTFPGQGAVEVWPITDSKSEQAAKDAGMLPAKEIHSLIVEGDDRAGIGYEIANAVAGAEINLHFAMMQVIEKRFLGVFGFGSESDCNKAEGLIKQAVESGAKV